MKIKRFIEYFFAYLLVTSWLISMPVCAQLVATYSKPKTIEYQQAQESFRQNQFLEKIAAYVNSRVRLPSGVRLVAAECGAANAYYTPQRRAVVLCYELIKDMMTGVAQDFPHLEPERSLEVGVGALFFVVFHEIGHALIHLLSLPGIGRDEDAADAIATYFALHSPNRTATVTGATWFFRKKGVSYTVKHYGNEHSLDEQRQLNIACHALGSSAQTFGKLAAHLKLPTERARRCPAEYAQLESSVRRLLGSHLRY